MILRVGSVRPVPKLFVLTPLQLACRRASTLPAKETPDKKAPAVKTTAIKTYTYRRQANPPSTTLPADLDVPARGPNQNILSYGFQSGRAYWQFYKQGVKNVWNNRKLANAVKAQHKADPVVELRDNIDASKIPFTRREFQLLRRSKHDMRRVPAFALLLVIFGEWLPVFVIFVNGVVPLPCRIPRQVENAERKREVQRLQGRKLLFDAQQRGALHKQRVPDDDKQLRALGPLQIDLDTAAKDLRNHTDTSVPLYMNLAFTNFNLRSPLWDRTKAYTFVPSLLWRIKLKSHLEYMVVDDALLLRDGGVDGLHPKSVFEACTERGISVVKKEAGQYRPDAMLRADLKTWLEEKRSSAWWKLLSEKEK